MGIIDQPDQKERTSRSYCSMSQTTTSKQDRLTPPWQEGACTHTVRPRNPLSTCQVPSISVIWVHLQLNPCSATVTLFEPASP